MLADDVRYNGAEAVCGIGIQGNSHNRSEAVTAATPEVSLAYLQSCRVTPNENVEAKKFINAGNGMNVTRYVKGIHTANIEFSFWIPKDLDQTTPMEVWLLKLAIDGTDDATSAEPEVYTIPSATDFGEYGSDFLKVPFIEVGYNKTGAITKHDLTGACMARANFHWEEFQPVLITFNMDALKGEKSVSAFTGLTEATEEPFTWGDTSMAYGDAGSASAQTNIRMVDLNIEYVKELVGDLANAATTRTGTGWRIHRRNISGQIKFDLATDIDNGQDLWEDYYNDSSGTASPTEGVKLKDLFITMYQSATYNIVLELHDLVLFGIPDEVVGEGNPNITVAFTCSNIVEKHKCIQASTPPTNWHETNQ